ncbi:MAG: hypothetical protein ACR2OE_13455 [Thermomicrobiales bacterium]
MNNRPGDAETNPGEYRPAGENQGINATFTSDQVAAAFEVAPERVLAAFQGEFKLGANARVDSSQAQQLAEVILGDKPLDEREAALIRLGAYTPRADHDVGLGEKSPADESDRLKRTANTADGERE